MLRLGGKNWYEGKVKFTTMLVSLQLTTCGLAEEDTAASLGRAKVRAGDGDLRVCGTTLWAYGGDLRRRNSRCDRITTERGPNQVHLAAAVVDVHGVAQGQRLPRGR